MVIRKSRALLLKIAFVFTLLLLVSFFLIENIVNTETSVPQASNTDYSPASIEEKNDSTMAKASIVAKNENRTDPNVKLPAIFISNVHYYESDKIISVRSIIDNAFPDNCIYSFKEENTGRTLSILVDAAEENGAVSCNGDISTAHIPYTGDISVTANLKIDDSTFVSNNLSLSM